MIKSKVITILLVSIVFNLVKQAKNFEGIASYRYKAKLMEFNIKDPLEKSEVSKSLNQDSEKIYKLTFSYNESLFKEVISPSINSDVQVLSNALEGTTYIDN